MMGKYCAAVTLHEIGKVRAQILLFRVMNDLCCRATRAVRVTRAVTSPGRENGSHNDAVDGDTAAADSTEQKDLKPSD